MDLFILVLRCLWIQFRRIKVVAGFEYSSSSDLDDYLMVLLHISMCNKKEVSYAETPKVETNKISHGTKALALLTKSSTTVTVQGFTNSVQGFTRTRLSKVT